MTKVSADMPARQVASPGGAPSFTEDQPPQRSGVYLLHADRPHPVYGWQHYIGWSGDVERRVADHRRSKGSRVTREWRRAGIPFRLAHVWPGGTHADERALQHIKGRYLCSVCQGLDP
jgi:predicted GIY-YIG superfamily endonuclease